MHRRMSVAATGQRGFWPSTLPPGESASRGRLSRRENDLRRSALGFAHGSIATVILALVIAFVASQCFAPSVLAGEPEPIDEIPIDDFDREHWSFSPIANPQVPNVRRSDWPRTSIDRFYPVATRGSVACSRLQWPIATR